MDPIVPSAPQPADDTATPLAGGAADALNAPAAEAQTPAGDLTHHLGNLARARPIATITVAVLAGIGLASVTGYLIANSRHRRWHG